MMEEYLLPLWSNASPKVSGETTLLWFNSDSPTNIFSNNDNDNRKINDNLIIKSHYTTVHHNNFMFRFFNDLFTVRFGNVFSSSVLLRSESYDSQCLSLNINLHLIFVVAVVVGLTWSVEWWTVRSAARSVTGDCSKK